MSLILVLAVSVRAPGQAAAEGGAGLGAVPLEVAVEGGEGLDPAPLGPGEPDFGGSMPVST